MTKEESERRFMYHRFTKWVPGYFCYICAEPITEGKLCKKHKGYFSDKGYSSDDKNEESQG